MPRSGASSVAASFSSVVLPDPLGPCRATISPGLDGEAHAVHGADLLARAAIVLDDVARARAPLGPGSRRRPAVIRWPAAQARSATGASSRLALPHSSPSPIVSDWSAPDSPVGSPTVIRTAMPSSASERSSSRIPSRWCRSTPAHGLVDQQQPRLQRERGGDRETHALARVELGEASRAEARSPPTRSSASCARVRACAPGTPLTSSPTIDLLDRGLSRGGPKRLLAVADLATEDLLAVLGQVAPGEADGSRRRARRSPPRGATASCAPSRAGPTPRPVRRRRCSATHRRAPPARARRSARRLETCRSSSRLMDAVPARPTLPQPACPRRRW